VYDQSDMGNHLGKRHNLVDATRHPITVGPARVPVYVSAVSLLLRLQCSVIDFRVSVVEVQ
jgi:hypothetical protein